MRAWENPAHSRRPAVTTGSLAVAGARMIYDYVESPIGQLLLAADEGGLRYVGFELGRHPVWIGDDWQRDPGALGGARAQLDAYFAGELTQFDLPLAA